MNKKKTARPSAELSGALQGLLPGVLPGPQHRPRARSVKQVAAQVLAGLVEQSQGLTPAQQWELHMILARDLYSRAVNGWAGVELGLNGLCQGEGI